MLDTVVISGDACCNVGFGTLVSVFVFSVVWSELRMTSAIKVVICGRQCMSAREWSVYSHLR